MEKLCDCYSLYGIQMYSLKTMLLLWENYATLELKPQYLVAGVMLTTGQHIRFE